MRNTIIATAVAVLLCAGSVGCKTPSKMAWWKTADKTGTESMALANSAPALPADLAKQAEGLATAAPSIQLSEDGKAAPYTPTTVAAAAPAFTPTAAPGAYPSTSAAPYSSTAASSIAASTPVPAAQSANLGSVNLPYNPNAVPPAKTVVAATSPAVSPAPSVDRYASAVTTNAASAYGGANAPSASSAVPQFGGADRYGSASAPIIASAVPQISTKTTSPATGPLAPAMNAASAYVASVPTTSQAIPPTTPPATTQYGGGDRYATADSSLAASAAPQVQTATPAPTTPAPAVVASAAPYRPGGTASYPTGAAFEVASRPSTTTQQVPNVGAPQPTTQPSQAPRYR